MNAIFLNDNKYDFLRDDVRLGNNIILLALGGSYAYGTNVEGSDIDVRGCALNSKRAILSGKKFETVRNIETDTVIYSFEKLVSLLAKCNPNTIEILGCKPEDYLYVSPVGQELLDNKELFLSQEAFYSFGGYANAQLRRLQNYVVRNEDDKVREKHLLNIIENAKHTFPEKYFDFDEDSINLYIDKSNSEDKDSEIFMDINLHHYPLRDYKSMVSDMHNIVKDYAKLGKRNHNALEHDKLSKHMMHLVRLYLMGRDILWDGEIKTYRDNEHELLSMIRDGKFLTDEGAPDFSFYEMIDELEEDFQTALKMTKLPRKPDYEKIDDFICSVNERIIRDDKSRRELLAKKVLEGMRELTSEENEAIEKYLESISKPTGINVFDEFD